MTVDWLITQDRILVNFDDSRVMMAYKFQTFMIYGILDQYQVNSEVTGLDLP